MKILIADDNPTIQELTGTVMESWGYEYDMVSNGQEAIVHAKTNEGEYDLCLMDMDMPIMKGWETAKIIRQTLKYFPIMAVTGNIELRKNYSRFGIDDCLEKPYKLDKLYRKIKELTIKSVKIHTKQSQISLGRKWPMNSDELRELRELDKRGLTKFSLIDTNYKFIVHKNIQNKISHDLIAKEKQLTEFLDRSPDDPGIIHLYAANLRANKRHILPEVLDQLAKEEDEEMEKHRTKAEYSERENLES